MALAEGSDDVIGLGLLALGVAGYLLAGAATPRSGLALRMALGFVLGQAAFLLHLNILVRVGLGIQLSSGLALALVLMEAVGLRLSASGRAYRRPITAADLRLLGIATLPFLYALLWQLAYRDDDYFIHWPLVALFRQDVFPPVNPFFPQLSYSGHYGRDLLSAGVSFFWPWDFQDLMVGQTALSQGALLILVFAVFRNNLGPASGTFAVALGFLGINASIRLGLMDTFQNNNSLANVLLFSSAVLLSEAAVMRRMAGRLCAFFLLTALVLVYETHWVCLVGGAVLALVPALMSRLGRLRALRVCAVIGLSAFVALGQGGTLTNFLERRVVDRHEPSEDVVGLSQAVNVTFPKTSLTVTSRDGRELPIFSASFRGEAGPWPIWLPVFALLLALLRAPGPLTVALSGGVALLIPIFVDFGRYNSNVFRFLFLAGACSAASAGSLAAVPLRWLRLRPTVRTGVALLLVAQTISFCSTAIQRLGSMVRDALTVPEHYPWSARAWAIQKGNGPSTLADLQMADAVRQVPGAPRLLQVRRDGRYVRSASSTIGASAVVASFGEAFPLGFSLKPAVMGQASNLWPSSLLAEAFQATGNPGLLSGIGATLVDIAPGAMQEDAARKLLNDGRASLVVGLETPEGVRQLIRIKNRPPAPPPGLKARVRSISLPEPLWSGEVAAAVVTLEFETPPPTAVRLGYRLLANGSQTNPLDELDQDVALEGQTSGVWTGTLTFVAPATPGRYEVRLNQRFTEGTWDLLLAAGAKAPVANVREP